MAKGAIKAVIATQYDDTGLKKAQKSVGSFAKGLKSTLAGLGVGLSVGAVFNQFEQAARQAAQDARSYAVLANTIKNVTGATDGAIVSSDKWLSSLSMQVGIADDELRPVLGRLVSATGDLTQAQGLLAVATDLAAAKNIDVTTAGNALAKAVGGQTTALFRLAPELKKSSDWMATLKQNTEGAAATAANADPFQRLTVIFGEMQESIGRALLPALQKVANYLSSPEFQDAFNNLATDFTNIVTGIEIVADSIGSAIDWINKKFSEFGIGFDVMGFLQKILPVISGIKTITDFLGNIGKTANAKATGQGGSVMDSYLYNTGQLAKKQTSFKLPSVSGTGSKQTTAKVQATLNAVQQAATDAYLAALKIYNEAVTAADAIMSANKEVMASFKDMFKVVPEMGQFESKVVDSFTSIYDSIKSALADKRIFQSAANSLTAFVDSTVANMRALAKQRDALAAKIDVARAITSGVTGLAQITGMLDTVTQSVTTSVRSMSNGIETIMTKTTDVTTSGGLIDNFTTLVNKTKKFAQNLIDLKKLGLNKNLFAQLVSAGADAGGATAEALVQGGSDIILAMNDLYNQLDLQAGIIAQNTTDIMYEVGSQIVSNGFIEGLVSQSDALAAAAQKMADTFASAFTAQLGGAVQAALPPAPVLDTSATRRLGVSANFANMLSSMGIASGGLASFSKNAAGTNVLTAPASVINLYLNAQGTGVTGSALAQQMITEIKKYERSNGAVWQPAQ